MSDEAVRMILDWLSAHGWVIFWTVVLIAYLISERK